MNTTCNTNREYDEFMEMFYWKKRERIHLETGVDGSDIKIDLLAR
jgi:hypothetical protein